MSPSAIMSSCFFTSLCFFLFAFTIMASSSSSSSTTHASYTTVSGISGDELYNKLSFVTSYYTGGKRLFGELPNNTAYYNFEKKYASLQIQKHRRTNATGVYEVQGYFLIQFPYWYGGESGHSLQRDRKYDYDGSRGRDKAKGAVRISLEGSWLEKSRQLVMVGSASRLVDGKTVILDAVLDLNYTAKNNPTIYTSYISGTLKSTVSENNPGYFDPLMIFSFQTLPSYNYSLLAFAEDSDVQEDQWLSYEENKYCWVIAGESIALDLEYAEECGEHCNCSPFDTRSKSDESLPRVLLLSLIQCSQSERKMRFMATFQNTSCDQGFGLNSTVIGEASWDDEKKEFTGVACRLLDNEIGDCRMRLSLRYTSIFTIKNEPQLVGEFRSTRNVDESGYFTKIHLTNSDGCGLVTLPEVRYEYTELDRVRNSCSAKRHVKKGNTYPMQSDSLSLEFTVENLKGEKFARACTSPLSINGLYETKSVRFDSEDTSHSNISYNIILNSSPELKSGYLLQRLNSSANRRNEVVITAEGVYNAENGYLCMIGCRKLVKNSTHTSMDCEILVTFEFSPVTGERGGRSKGTIASKRAKTDPLYFDDMIMYPTSYYYEEATNTIWRMDFEIAMVLISNTLVCIFVARQILHVRRNPEVPSFISLVMLLILSVGHVIPLTLNFEAFYATRYTVEGVISNSGMLEANEVTVRLSYLVVFVLQMRLLQLVWTAKLDKNEHEKGGYVMVSLYVAGGILALLLNSMTDRDAITVQEGESSYILYQQDEVWGGLRYYGGLILDSFLLPQILVNAFGGSSEKALSSSFYIGISAVRLAPHVYNQYRAHNYPVVDVKNTYYYANPALGFFSGGWDFMISIWILALVVIVFLQQQRGRRFLLNV